MQYHEANRLLTTVRRAWPEVYSGTVGDSFDCWYVHIGRVQNQNWFTDLKSLWDFIIIEREYNGGVLPAELLYNQTERQRHDAAIARAVKDMVRRVRARP